MGRDDVTVSAGYGHIGVAVRVDAATSSAGAPACAACSAAAARVGGHAAGRAGHTGVTPFYTDCSEGDRGSQ